MPKKAETYYIEKVLKTRIRNGKVEHLIKWKNYSAKWSTWEPEEFLLISDDEETSPKKPRTSTGSRKIKKTSTKVAPRTTKNTGNKTTPQATTNGAAVSNETVPPTTNTSGDKTGSRKRKTNRKDAAPAAKDATKKESTETALRTAKNTETTPQATTNGATVSNETLPPTTKTSGDKTGSRKRKTNGKDTVPAATDVPRKKSIETAPLESSTKKDADEFFSIKKILAKRIVNTKIEYLVHWQGYHIDTSTWEPEFSLKTDYCQMYCDSLKHAFLD